MTITVIAQDDDYPEDRDSKTIWDDYVLVCAGRAQLTHVTTSTSRDGTQTHVITVKGVRRASPPAPATSGICRQCGCTDDDCRQCLEVTAAPCWWVEPDLCSRCAGVQT